MKKFVFLMIAVLFQANLVAFPKMSPRVLTTSLVCSIAMLVGAGWKAYDKNEEYERELKEAELFTGIVTAPVIFIDPGLARDLRRGGAKMFVNEPDYTNQYILGGIGLLGTLGSGGMLLRPRSVIPSPKPQN